MGADDGYWRGPRGAIVVVERRPHGGAHGSGHDDGSHHHGLVRPRPLRRPRRWPRRHRDGRPLNRLAPSETSRAFLTRLASIAIAIALAALAYRVAHVLILSFGAMLGAILLATAADWIAARTRLPRGVGLAIATLMLLGVLGLIGWLFGTETGRQGAQLMQTLPRDWITLRATVEANPLGKLLSNSFTQGSQGSRLAHLLLGAGWGGAEIAANFLIILIGAVFFAAQPGVYRRGALLLVPRPYRGAAGDAIDHLVTALRLWLLTQLISMTMMGIMIGLGLWWSGVQAPEALGLLGGLSEFIPYVGPTLAMIPAIVVALVGHGSIWGVLGTYAAVRLVQVQIITPLISQRMVSVPAGLYLFLIIAMGSAFGAYGMFFAGALSVAAYSLTISLYVRDTLGEDVPPPGA